jgi:DNA (cytosine-5)-methyltransferase 1
MGSAYYNEIDPYAAQWLRNLIRRGLIAPGEVDERSIEDVTPSDIARFTQCHFFAGVGVWSHALRQAGWGDERQVWTGSCPCQPFSEAGSGNGFADERHLWPAFFHLISECRPVAVFGEQVETAVKHGWLDLVQTDLEGIGYTTGAAGLCAAGVGAPHIRQRLYWGASKSWVGDPDDAGLEGHTGDGHLRGQQDPTGSVATSGSPVAWSDVEWLAFGDVERPVQPGLGPMAPRTPNHVGRCRAYGNAIVAPLATEFIKAYMACSPA